MIRAIRLLDAYAESGTVRSWSIEVTQTAPLTYRVRFVTELMPPRGVWLCPFDDPREALEHWEKFVDGEREVPDLDGLGVVVADVCKEVLG